MKSNNLSSAKGLQPFVFCFGMFLLAISFSIVICFSTFYAFHSINPDSGMAKAGQTQQNGTGKNVYAFVK